MGTASPLRGFFQTGQTRSLRWRAEQLLNLRRLLRENDAAVLDALWTDLHKCPSEARLTELGIVEDEISVALRHLRAWNRRSPLPVPIKYLPARAFQVPQPVGIALIIAPWNYPLQLALVPLVGAMAAGCPAVIKPSELAPTTASLLENLLPRYLDSRAYRVVLGDSAITTKLLQENFDHIFFTGSEAVGTIVMQAASKHLTPVTLELGGKSPVWIDDSVPLRRAARRLAWAKFTNAGQTCVAPDYVLVPSTLAGELAKELWRAIENMWGTDPRQSPGYGRIINDRHFQRLAGLLDGAPIVAGGQSDRSDLYLAPTLLHFESWEEAASQKVMAQEIFGPVLPIIEVSDHREAISVINSGPHPLTLHVFSKRRPVVDEFIAETTSGSVALNVGLVQAGATSLPFGGVGSSGLGSYHGRRSWETFTHRKPVVTKPYVPETLRFIQPPYSKVKERLIRFISRG